MAYTVKIIIIFCYSLLWCSLEHEFSHVNFCWLMTFAFSRVRFTQLSILWLKYCIRTLLLHLLVANFKMKYQLFQDKISERAVTRGREQQPIRVQASPEQKCRGFPSRLFKCLLTQSLIASPPRSLLSPHGTEQNYKSVLICGVTLERLGVSLRRSTLI